MANRRRRRSGHQRLECPLFAAPIRCFKLFHNLRDDDHVVALRGGIFEGLIDGEAGLWDVVGPDVKDRKAVSGWFHPGDIDLFELLDVGEDVVELGGELRFFLRRERQAGEVRDVVDIEVGRRRHRASRTLGLPLSVKQMFTSPSTGGRTGRNIELAGGGLLH